MASKMKCRGNNYVIKELPSSRKKVFTKRELPKTASSDDGMDDINSDIEGSVSEEDKKLSHNKRKKTPISI